MSQIYTKELTCYILPCQAAISAGPILEDLRALDRILVATEVGDFPLKRVTAVVFTVNEASLVFCTCLFVSDTLEVMVVFTTV